MTQVFFTIYTSGKNIESVFEGNLKKKFKGEESSRSRERKLTHDQDYSVNLESNLFRLKQEVKEGQWICLHKYHQEAR